MLEDTNSLDGAHIMYHFEDERFACDIFWMWFNKINFLYNNNINHFRGANFCENDENDIALYLAYG